MVTLSKWDNQRPIQSDTFRSFDMLIINGWGIKISTLGEDQVMVFAIHPFLDETELRYFTDFNDAHKWIECITDDWY